ncbi:MAG: DUF3015 family protein [Campylobacterales bacterium]|nr:DUF3015 family protein [Campylobacterales bacterium]
MKNILMNLLTIMVLSTLGMSDVSHKNKSIVNERAKEFVASNMYILKKEIAMGHGESIDTLAELLNIKNVALFSASLQANYNRIYMTQNGTIADVFNSISAASM